MLVVWGLGTRKERDSTISRLPNNDDAGDDHEKNNSSSSNRNSRSSS